MDRAIQAHNGETIKQSGISTSKYDCYGGSQKNNSTTDSKMMAIRMSN